VACSPARRRSGFQEIMDLLGQGRRWFLFGDQEACLAVLDGEAAFTRGKSTSA